MSKPQIIIEPHRDGWRTRPGTDYEVLRSFLADTKANNIKDTDGVVTFEGYTPPWSKAAQARQKRIDKMPLTVWGNLAGLSEEEEDNAQPVQLREVSLQGSPEVLRELALFLIETAGRLERADFDHEHWRMRADTPDTQADVIVIGRGE